MTIRMSDEVMNSFSRIAKMSDAHLKEIARIYAWLSELDADIEKGRVALEFWNVRDSAAGWLESCCALQSGTPVWRLYQRINKHAVALVALHEGSLWVLDICGRKGLEAAERRLCSSK